MDPSLSSASEEGAAVARMQEDSRQEELQTMPTSTDAAAEETPSSSDRDVAALPDPPSAAEESVYDGDEQALSRSSCAARRTVEDLEAKAAFRKTPQGQHTPADGRRTTAATKPGAFAVAGCGEGDSGSSLTARGDSEEELGLGSQTSRTEYSEAFSSASESTTEEVGASVGDAAAKADSGQYHQEHYAVDDEIPMIHAELAVEELPIMIRAEPVQEPTQAYPIEAHIHHHPQEVEHVQIDEEAPAHNNIDVAVTNIQHVPPGTAPFHHDDDDDGSITKMKKFCRVNSKRIWQCHVLLLIVGLVVAIAVPKLQQQEKTWNALEDTSFWDNDDFHGPPVPAAAPPQEILGDLYHEATPINSDNEELEDNLDNLEGFLEEFVDEVSESFPAPMAVTKPPTPAPSSETVYPFDCYTRTVDIALAQTDMMEMAASGNVSGVMTPDGFIQDDRIFVLCPYTTIRLGTLDDPEVGFVNGDYPLTALMDSVEIQCGPSGDRSHHCVIDGGSLQVLLNPSLPEPLAGAAVNRTDNVIFRGITFTGQLTDVKSDSSMGGVSVFANNPGTNVTFIDCSWEDMEAPQGLVHVGGETGNKWSFGPSMDLTFEDCTFSNIVHGGGPLMGVFGQELSLRRSSFTNVTLPETIDSCKLDSSDSLEYCHGLLHCFERSVCELEDICVQGLEYAGQAAVVTASYNTNLTVSGSKYFSALEPHPSTAYSTGPVCSSGMVQFKDTSFHEANCVSDSSNWTSWDRDICFP